jgi:hypothetical protein
MSKPGRPTKNGLQEISMLLRVTMVVYAYRRARDAGEKHSVAIDEAVTYIRETAPRMRISATGVKRIVAQWLSKQRPTCLFVSKPDPEHSLTLVPGRDGKWVYARIAYTASVGPHPIYPRANAAKKHGEIGTDC